MFWVCNPLTWRLLRKAYVFYSIYKLSLVNFHALWQIDIKYPVFFWRLPLGFTTQFVMESGLRFKSIKYIKSKQFIKNKDESCPKGFTKKIQDWHFFIATKSTKTRVMCHILLRLHFKMSMANWAYDRNAKSYIVYYVSE